MKRLLSLIPCLLMAGILFGDFVSAAGQSKETATQFYRGKRIILLVGFSPGGGFDSLARLIAPYIEKNTGAKVVVENMPGAGGVVALNHTYNIAKPDGLTICINEAPDLLMRELVGHEGMKYDMARFIYLARLTHDLKGLFVGKNTPFRSVDDIRRAPLVKFSVDDRAGALALPVLTVGAAFDLKNLKEVVGYKSASEARLAVLKGEVDATGGSITPFLPLVDSGDLIPIVVTGSRREKTLPGIRTIYEVAPNMSQESKDMVDALVKMMEGGRTVFLGPGVPEDRVQFLRSAFAKALNDPELVANVHKTLKAEVLYSPGDEYYSYIMDCLSSVQRLKDKLKFLVNERY